MHRGITPSRAEPVTGVTRDARARQVSTRQSSALEYPGDAPSETQLLQARTDAGWTRADELAVRNSLRLVRCTILQRRYPAAPVSSLFLFARKQDLAFEQKVPGRPSQRHHVRFWKRPPGWYLPGGLLVDWVGAGTYDRSVGLSLYTLQITNRIGDNTDEERDNILQSLHHCGAIGSVQLPHPGAVASRNGR